MARWMNRKRKEVIKERGIEDKDTEGGTPECSLLGSEEFMDFEHHVVSPSHHPCSRAQCACMSACNRMIYILSSAFFIVLLQHCLYSGLTNQPL